MERIETAPLVLKAWMIQDIQVSQLKNVDTSQIEGVLYLPDRPEKVKRILAIFADDLINIYKGDYTTEVQLKISRTTLTISFKQGYPFYYQTSAFEGLLKHINHEFTISECTDDNAVHNIINNLINKLFENSQYMLERYSTIEDKQSLYANLKIVDKLLFENDTLFKTFSYLDSIHEADQYANHMFGHVSANLYTSDAGYYVFVQFGNVTFSISKSSITIKRKVSAVKYDIVGVYSTKKMNIQQLEAGFLACYNNEYETDYTNVKDMVLIHNMIEI